MIEKTELQSRLTSAFKSLTNFEIKTISENVNETKYIVKQYLQGIIRFEDLAEQILKEAERIIDNKKISIK